MKTAKCAVFPRARQETGGVLADGFRVSKVLVLDEPVDGLDPVMRRQVWSILMADVAENGTTVLVSSHNLRELEDVCDHDWHYEQGQATT